MGLFNALKKRDVPDSLPDLAVGHLAPNGPVFPDQPDMLTQPVTSSSARQKIPPMHSSSIPPVKLQAAPIQVAPPQMPSSLPPVKPRQIRETPNVGSGFESPRSSPVQYIPINFQPNGHMNITQEVDENDIVLQKQLLKEAEEALIRKDSAVESVSPRVEPIHQQSERVKDLRMNVQPRKPVLPSEDQGFFKDMISHAMGEMESLDRLDEWYKNKFQSEDVVAQLRQYWKQQRPEMLLKIFGAELREKILKKSDSLHSLEKEWQEIYFALLSKEEALRKEEKELKQMLGEFVGLCKKYNPPKE